MSTIEKPCNQKCYINDDDICLGCYRTLSDILAWKKINLEQKKEVLRNASVCREKYLRQNNITKNHWFMYKVV